MEEMTARVRFPHKIVTRPLSKIEREELVITG